MDKDAQPQEITLGYIATMGFIAIFSLLFLTSLISGRPMGIVFMGFLAFMWTNIFDRVLIQQSNIMLNGWVKLLITIVLLYVFASR